LTKCHFEELQPSDYIKETGKRAHKLAVL